VERVAGRLVVPCLLDTARDSELEPNDLRSFAINGRRLAEQVADNPAEILEPIPGLWSLGQGAGNRWLFLTLRRRAVDGPALLPLLRSIARDAGITLVGPRPSAEARLRLLDATDLRLVEVRNAIRVEPDGRLILDAATVQPAGPFVPCLSVCRRSRTVQVHGTPQPVPGQPLRLLEMLLSAWQRADPVRKTDIEAAFSGRSASDLVRDLRDALSAGRADAPSIRNWVLTEGSPAEYRLALPAGSVQITS
jgi:hypothetical protein